MNLKEGQALARKELDQAKSYALAVVRWCVMGICVGVLCGTVGAIFHHGIQWAVEQFGYFIEAFSYGEAGRCATTDGFRSNSGARR